MIANFLTSLQELADSDSRVHCSLNLNTETGRLSSRRPNLQNQPALEKDTYKIRKAFQASPGNNLIVADYGQLELRILASITGCRSMIDAFASGGDFHSRTAIDMFPYVKQAVESGECLLEWDYSGGQQPPKPLLKDKYAAERRKAKTLNFSIAYGKTAHGLSQDWGVSTKEAEEMLAAWYQARREVDDWQRETKSLAKREGITRTLMGRYRQLPDAMLKNRKLLGHAERASINSTFLSLTCFAAVWHAVFSIGSPHPGRGGRHCHDGHEQDQLERQAPEARMDPAAADPRRGDIGGPGGDGRGGLRGGHPVHGAAVGVRARPDRGPARRRRLVQAQELVRSQVIRVNSKRICAGSFLFLCFAIEALPVRARSQRSDKVVH
jgi:hypothetical protein